MKIQVNTDNNIEGRAALAAHVEDTVAKALRHFSAQITRVEVHLRDENSETKGGTDKRCVIEARLEGMQPIAATSDAETINDAINSASDKLASALKRTLDRKNAHR